MIKEHSQGIYEIENFLTEDELCALLLSASPDGFIESHSGNVVKDLIPESLACVPNISDRLLSYFENHQSHTQITNIRRLQDNQGMSAHTDGGYPNSKQKIIFGIAIYLNDDFLGGEISYPDLGLSIKPQTCSMVIHNAQLLHEVLPVTFGTRYSLTAFVFGDESTKVRI